MLATRGQDPGLDHSFGTDPCEGGGLIERHRHGLDHVREVGGQSVFKGTFRVIQPSHQNSQHPSFDIDNAFCSHTKPIL